MLILITNQCGAGCTHCMQDSTPKTGQHMTREVFDKSLDFATRIEGLAWARGVRPLMLLAGGEPTEHPQIVDYINRVIQRGMHPVLLTNGYWMADKELCAAILHPKNHGLFIQVTYDSRFYPRSPPTVDDPRIFYKTDIEKLIPLDVPADET